METRYMTVAEYADLMGLHEQSVRRMCENGSVKCMKVGSRWRIAADAPAKREDPRIGSVEGALLAVAESMESMAAEIRKAIAGAVGKEGR